MRIGNKKEFYGGVQNMPSLVLEGGTFRSIFTCGVLDALLEKEIMFPYCIGVSAGISNGVSYISKQKRRNYKVLMKYRNDKRYIGISNYKRCKSFFGLDFVFGEVPNELEPFDMKTFLTYEGKYLVGVTNAETGRAEYKLGKDMDSEFTMLRATCALPVFFPAIELDGKKYFDGGISESIPIRKAVRDGNKKHLIVLTRTKDYRKTLNKEAVLSARLLEKKYPNLAKKILNRHIRYNKMVEYCNQLEAEGKAVILRPSQPLNTFEKDLKILRKSYIEGYRLTMDKLEEIQGLF